MRVVLAHSGGFVTSAAIPWLTQHCAAEVVTVTLDVGQGRELAAVRERALAAGAVRAHVIDAREEFVRDFAQPALQAGLFGEDAGILMAALSRPLVARRLVDMARMESATAVAHGAEPGAPLEAALAAAIRSLDPSLRVIAPAREWKETGADPIALARARGILIPSAEPFRVDANVFGRVITASGPNIPAQAYALTRPVDGAPEAAAFVTIEFKDGAALRANGVEMQPLELIESLETIAGVHGVGRRTGVGGAAGHAWAVESPAAAVLHAARQALERAVLGEDLATLKQQLAGVYRRLTMEGRWYADLRPSIDAFVGVLQPRLTGHVRVKLSKGDCIVMQVESPHAVDGGEGSTHPKAVA